MKNCALLLGLLLFAKVKASCENGNCTDQPTVTKDFLETQGNSNANLAWLVTPALFALGVVYLIYKCCRDGLCNCRRLRRRAITEYHRDHGYIPLSQVVLHTGHTPDPPPGQRRHLVLIHNQTFCITLRDTPDACPGVSRCLHANEPHICVQQVPGQPPQATIVGPPTYEEALAQKQDNEDAERPPRYSEACDEESGEPSSLADSKLLGSVPARQVRFDTRRRHFSAQDCRVLLPDTDTIQHRCFSFSGLRDALRRNQHCEVLDDSVFLSVEVIGPDGAASTGQPLPDDVRIVNDIEHIEVVRRNRHSSGPCARVRSATRQRNASAPDPSRKTARHSPQ